MESITAFGIRPALFCMFRVSNSFVALFIRGQLAAHALPRACLRDLRAERQQTENTVAVAVAVSYLVPAAAVAAAAVPAVAAVGVWVALDVSDGGLPVGSEFGC